ncbi:TetR family transcriptional regulator [Paeniglutamicibacter cryotolerans]|uniref:AcrR family transcriptional regulator n=1 Tax=Paeniglutamicibacter cryotolerans TaxID=670079 RepID=A0A839QNW9_9MICC|nr:TetR family transcriptional regulator [Paeniglutamicibacter cryotolerans]MBB2997617.1 AcrR family transcriptional regulator [Paeniglutamicibacter cryotolerans]
MALPVKTSRPYDSSARRQGAEHKRQAILDSARTLFLASGYVGTTIAAIAAEAVVSTETIYKTFGSKARLLRDIYNEGLLGVGPVSAEQRSDLLQAEATDGRGLLLALGMFTAEIGPLAAPIRTLIRDAAAQDEQMARLLVEIDQDRYERMLHNARHMVDRNLLATGITAEFAADIMWFYTAPEVCEKLMLGRNWTARELGTFVGKAIGAALLDEGSLD